MHRSTNYSIDDLLHVMARLRDPDGGCPWDLKQTFQSIVPSTIEESYELADAIEREDYSHVSEELGDVLFQVVFYSQLGHEQGLFDFAAVVDTLVSKLLRRHPHVFPEGEPYGESRQDDIDEAQVKANWEAIKQQERAEKTQHGVLDDIPRALPALTRAMKLQKRAAHVGFDWQDWQGVIPKINEEWQELQTALEQQERDAIAHEIGDLLFAVSNLARKLGMDPESCLRQSNHRFEQRFHYIEQGLDAQGKTPQQATLLEMDQLWEEAKRRYKASPDQ